MNFKDPQKVWTVVDAMRTADLPRATNRTLINELYNGFPPFTEEQRKENKIQHNFNSLEGPNIIHSARRQLYNAFLKPGDFFAARTDMGPSHLRRTWARIVTKEVNRVMKRSLAYTETLRSTQAQLCLHGIGPVLWENSSKWCPYARGIEDVLVPSGTLVSMENLDHFCVFRRYTPAELYRATHGDVVDPGWNVPLADKIIAALSKQPIMATNWNDWRFPEKLVEDIKENAGFYGSDAVPTINCWDFYFLSDDGKSWKRRIIIDGYAPTNAATAETSGLTQGFSAEFLFDPGNRDYAPDISQILHVQFADCSSVAPFRWHSVRSLGYMLYSVCHVQNRLRCRFTDAQMMEMMWFFRNVPDEDREKLLQVTLYHMGIIPEGVNFVPGNERYRPDYNLIQMGLAQNRQLMSENSAAFVQDINDGTSKELTATETMARVNNSSAMVGSMLNLAYTYQTHQFREIFRRFCKSEDSDCVGVRERCVRQGVPEQIFNYPESWEIEPERVLGSGNKTLEIAQADKLMAARSLYDPEAQRQILHIYTEANTDDPMLAEALVPPAKDDEFTDTQQEAAQSIATLMLGLPCPPSRTVAISEYVQTQLQMLMQLVQQYEQMGGMVDQKTLMGLVNVLQSIEPLIQRVEQDPNEKQNVKQMMDMFGQAQNLIKAFAQRLQEQQQQSQIDPETQAKVQALQMTTQAKLQSSEATAQQKLRHKEIAFNQKVGQNDVKLNQQLRQKSVQTGADVHDKDLRTAADLLSQSAKMRAEQAKHMQGLSHAEDTHRQSLVHQAEDEPTTE